MDAMGVTAGFAEATPGAAAAGAVPEATAEEIAEAAAIAGRQAEEAAAATLVSDCNREVAGGGCGSHFLLFPAADSGASASIPLVQEPETWWSRLEGIPGQRWRVRSDCMYGVNVRQGPMLDTPVLHHLRKGALCVQAAPLNVLTVDTYEGQTEVLRMAVEPAGWITVAMRGAETRGFLEIDIEIEREDRSNEGHWLKKPGRFLALEFPSDAQSCTSPWPVPAQGNPSHICNSARGHWLFPVDVVKLWQEEVVDALCMCCGSRLQPHMGQRCWKCSMHCCFSCQAKAEGPLPSTPNPSLSVAALLVPCGGSSCTPGAGSLCYLLGHDLVSGKLGWSATDGDCYVCEKPLTIEGTGCLSCPVKCCKDCTLPDPLRLSSQKKGICISCYKAVSPGDEHIINGRMFCNMCQGRRASVPYQAQQMVDEAVARGVAKKAAAAAAGAAQQLVEARAAAAVEVDIEDAQAAKSAAKRPADFVPRAASVPVQAAEDVARLDVAVHEEDASDNHKSTRKRRRRVLLDYPPSTGLQPLQLIPQALPPALSRSGFAMPPRALAPITVQARTPPSTPLHAMGSSSSSAPCLTLNREFGGDTLDTCICSLYVNLLQAPRADIFTPAVVDSLTEAGASSEAVRRLRVLYGLSTDGRQRCNAIALPSSYIYISTRCRKENTATELPNVSIVDSV